MKNIAFITCAKKPEITSDDRCLADALKLAGCQTYGIPWDAKTDWTKFDLLVLRSCWDYHVRSTEFKRWIDHIKNNRIPLYNPPDIVSWNINKKYLWDLARRGVAIPQGVFIGRSEKQKLQDEIKLIPSDMVVVKPAISATAYQTHLVSRDKLFDTEFTDLLFEHGDIIIQEFVKEIQTQGEMSLMYFDGQFSHAVMKQPKPGDFRVQGEFGGSAIPFSPTGDILQQADSIVKKIPRCLYARVDGVDANGKFVLMELELIEPVLFFTHFQAAASTMAAALLQSI
jgi:glutathione synthase/RimK-type ligase-like ATP-grasp enzyme